MVGIRNFIVQVTVDISSDEQRMRREKGYLNKLNLVLVQVSFGHHESPFV
jgi:exportin-1